MPVLFHSGTSLLDIKGRLTEKIQTDINAVSFAPTRDVTFVLHRSPGDLAESDRSRQPVARRQRFKSFTLRGLQ